MTQTFLNVCQCIWMLWFGILTSAKRLCRVKSGRPNHQSSLWQTDFPYISSTIAPSPEALCEGSITVESDGRICINGRVNYAQIVDAIRGEPMYQPAAQTISINGHLTSGSANVVLGASTRYLYEFVTSYNVNGVWYEVSDGIVDDLLVASRGTIDGVCLDPSIRGEESYYTITHNKYSLSGVNYSDLDREDLALLFFGRFNSVAEFHKSTEVEPGFIEYTKSRLIMGFTNAIVYAFPTSLYGVIPVFALTGTSRLIVQGTFSTKDFPNPFLAPDNLGGIEGVQIDTPWETLTKAIQDEGLFTTDNNKVPLYFNVVIKKIESDGVNYKCWGEGKTTMAAMDIEAPAGWGDKMDEFVNDIIYPALSKHGPVALHFGKRIPPNSDIIASALDVYGSCGVELGLDLDDCYHPQCERKTSPQNFEYPALYYT